MRVLVVEDARQLADAIADGLRGQAMAVDVVFDGQAAQESLAVIDYDVVVLDRDLPVVHGDEVCRSLAASGATVRILMLTAAGDLSERVTGLNLGADDYMSKPFSPDELLARVRVALRRVTGVGTDTGRLDRGELVIDFDRHRVQRGDTEIRLTPKEFELLVYLARHPNRVMPHRAILVAIWGEHAADRPEQLWALVTKVRKKIEPDPTIPRYLVSEPWVGYRLVTDASG